MDDRVKKPAAKWFKVDMSIEKMEFIIVAASSVLIAVLTGVLLYFVIHVTFWHTLYPDSLVGATIAAFIAVADVYVLRQWKNKIFDVVSTDIEHILFLLQVDFVVSCLIAVSVILSWDGFLVIDYLVAIVVTFMILAYSIYFLVDSCKGLMDSSCSEHLLSQISDHIREAGSGLKLKTLKVRRVGASIEVVAQVSMPRTSKLDDLKKVRQNVHKAFDESLPHEHITNIGFSLH